jgi:hypothetical protein
VTNNWYFTCVYNQIAKLCFNLMLHEVVKQSLKKYLFKTFTLYTFLNKILKSLELQVTCSHLWSHVFVDLLLWEEVEMKWSGILLSSFRNLLYALRPPRKFPRLCIVIQSLYGCVCLWRGSQVLEIWPPVSVAAETNRTSIVGLANMIAASSITPLLTSKQCSLLN